MPSSDLTIQQFKLPLTRQLINWVGRVGQRFGINMINLSSGSLLETSLRKTGLSDWGEDDFQTPLNVLLDSLEGEAKLTVLGRIAIRQTCLRILMNRLSIQENLRLHPEIKDIPIQRPLFIVGLPRTGTTLLHNLLAQDQDNRVPLFWELLFPSPLIFRGKHKADFRLTLTRKKIDQIYALSPQIFSIHPYNPTGPEECIILFQNTFKSLFFPLYYHIPKYTEWLLQENMVGAYQYFLRQLQLLHWQRPGQRWVLKSPAHLYFLDALLSVFPDACFIQTHRDPKEIIPSICSLSGMATQMSSDRLPFHYFGEKGLFLCKTAVDRGMNVRASVAASHFYDVQYQDLVTDPIAVVRSIYDYFGYDVKITMETNMKNWLAANPQHRYGIHRYSLDEFDLDQKTIDDQFALYRKRFNVQST
ncbi:MAG: sulfotransferase family protein [bacterium]